MKIYNSVTDLVGRTPILRISRYEDNLGVSAELYAKLEYFNPAGSAKDRIAKQMLLDLEQSGKLNKDTVIIEPTSGNTGIGLASMCAAKGISLIIVMPESMSAERRKLIAVYGAELVLTPASLGMQGAIDMAEKLNKEIENSVIAGQFINPSNPKAHYLTTGPEIYSDMDGDIDIFVSAVGTGGSITGVGQYLKEQNKSIKVVAAEPAASPLLSGGKAGPHKIQGIGANFVPEVLNREIYDEVITVTDDEALEYSRRMAECEGVLVGISAGAALFAAITLAGRPENKGKKIVVLLTDTGERYISTELFA